MRTLIRPQFPLYDATSYERAFGKPAPWDPTKPLKAWFDPAPTTGTYLKLSFGPGNPTLVPFTTLDAGKVNLPPEHKDYAQNYKTPPTNAQVEGPTGSVTDRRPANPELFCTEAEAQALRADLIEQGITNADAQVKDATAQNHFLAGDDGRKNFVITGNSAQGPLTVTVQRSIIDRNSYGVGRPGKWAVRNNGTAADIYWIPDDLHPNVVTSSVPIPYPPLPAGAHLESFLAGNPSSTYIVTPDATPANGSGGFTAADRAMLADLHAKFTDFLKGFGG